MLSILATNTTLSILYGRFIGPNKGHQKASIKKKRSFACLDGWGEPVALGVLIHILGTI